MEGLHGHENRVSEEARAKLISLIPIVQFDKANPVHEGFESCSICIGEMEGRIKILECAHGFHEDCIDSWIVKSRDSNIVCPVCRLNLRESLLKEEESPEENRGNGNEILAAVLEEIPTGEDSVELEL